MFGDYGVNWLTLFYNRVTSQQKVRCRMTGEGTSSLSSSSNRNGEASECSNYREILHTIKVCEQRLDSRLSGAVGSHVREVHHRRHLHRFSVGGQISGETRAVLPGFFPFFPGSGEGQGQAIPNRALKRPTREGCSRTSDPRYKGHVRRVESGDTNSTRDSKKDGYRIGGVHQVFFQTSMGG